MKYFFILMLLIISVSGTSQTLTSEEKVLESWLPASIGDYKLDGTPLTVTSKSEDRPYAMSSKVYKTETATLTVVIFDYEASPELLKKYTASWSTPVDDEIQTAQAATIENFPSWESYNKKDKTPQLYVNVKDRYLLYLSGKGNSLQFLKAVTAELKPQQLP